MKLISNFTNKRYTLNLISNINKNSLCVSKSNIFNSNIINNDNNYNNRLFHSSNQSYFFLGVLDKIKNTFNKDDKSKKEYPTNEKDLQEKTQINLEKQQQQQQQQQETQPIQPIVKEKKLTPEEEAQEKLRLEKENKDYHDFLQSGIKYDFNIFRQYLDQYFAQVKDDAKKKEVEGMMKIIDCMTPTERENPHIFHKTSFKLRSRLIKDSNTDIQTFATMINTYNSAKMLNDVLGSFKRQGKPIPNSADEIPSFLKSRAIEIKKEWEKLRAAEARRL